jgi:hypothetical protein
MPADHGGGLSVIRYPLLGTSAKEESDSGFTDWTLQDRIGRLLFIEVGDGEDPRQERICE